MATEAQKKAQRKYDEKKNTLFRSYSLKLNRREDADIIDQLEKEGIQTYIKKLIRADMEKSK